MDRRRHSIKQLLSVLIISLLTGFVGCEKADQILEAADKAKTLKEDMDKKAKEIKEKAQVLIPGSVQGLSDNEKKGTEESSNRAQKSREDKDD